MPISIFVDAGGTLSIKVQDEATVYFQGSLVRPSEVAWSPTIAASAADRVDEVRIVVKAKSANKDRFDQDYSSKNHIGTINSGPVKGTLPAQELVWTYSVQALKDGAIVAEKDPKIIIRK